MRSREESSFAPVNALLACSLFAFFEIQYKTKQIYRFDDKSRHYLSQSICSPKDILFIDDLKFVKLFSFNEVLIGLDIITSPTDNCVRSRALLYISLDSSKYCSKCI